MPTSSFTKAVEALAARQSQLHWRLDPHWPSADLTYPWPGREDEEVLISVYHAAQTTERFHRHDFFYLNYTYEGRYDSMSHLYRQSLAVEEGDIYAGQPQAGHSLCFPPEGATIIGVLIRPETVFRTFLPSLSTNSDLLCFLTSPATDRFSQEHLHFHPTREDAILPLLRLMVLEYAHPKEDTQEILKPLAIALLLQLVRRARHAPQPDGPRLIDRMRCYLYQHMASVTLKELSEQFSYHPNYISALFRQETGKTFSQLLLEARMDRAAQLLRETSLPVEKIAALLGYGNSSNFYKAFRSYYHCSPREFSLKSPG